MRESDTGSVSSFTCTHTRTSNKRTWFLLLGESGQKGYVVVEHGLLPLHFPQTRSRLERGVVPPLIFWLVFSSKRMRFTNENDGRCETPILDEERQTYGREGGGVRAATAEKVLRLHHHPHHTKARDREKTLNSKIPCNNDVAATTTRPGGRPSRTAATTSQTKIVDNRRGVSFACERGVQ